MLAIADLEWSPSNQEVRPDQSPQVAKSEVCPANAGCERKTALSEKCGPPGVVLGAKTRFALELVPVESSALRQVTGFRTGRGARALSRHIGSLPRCRRGFVADDGTPRRQIGTNVLPCAFRREQVTMLPQRFLAGGERGVLELGK